MNELISHLTETVIKKNCCELYNHTTYTMFRTETEYLYTVLKSLEYSRHNVNGPCLLDYLILSYVYQWFCTLALPLILDNY